MAAASPFLLLSSSEDQGGKLEEYDKEISINCLCLGSGRFLRSVLAPVFTECFDLSPPLILQTRGRSFLDSVLSGEKKDGRKSEALTYEVDTVAFDGTIQVEHVACHGAGTLGSPEGLQAVLQVMEKMTSISVIGMGVTEAGFRPNSPVVQDLCTILRKAHDLIASQKWEVKTPHGRIGVINTDNVPQNGTVLRQLVLDHLETGAQEEALRKFVRERVVFFNTMVDRITSQREGSHGLVPKCEPIPLKALVIQDENGDLPPILDPNAQVARGLMIRKSQGELDSDMALKLRVANGTHTAVAHAMALSGFLMTDVLAASDSVSSQLLMSYLDALVEGQVLPAAVSSSFFQTQEDDVRAVYADWKRRLQHAHFGLSTFFITQNGAAKGGIRLAPTITDLMLLGQEDRPVSVAMAFAVAALLRFLTPVCDDDSDTVSNVYKGWMDTKAAVSRDHVSRNLTNEEPVGTATAVTYADGLRYSLEGGWYEFRCSCDVSLSEQSGDASTLLLPQALAELRRGASPHECQDVVRAYLCSSSGGNLQSIAQNRKTRIRSSFQNFVGAVTTLYSRMVAGDLLLAILQEFSSTSELYPQGFQTDCRVLVDGPVMTTKTTATNAAWLGPLHYSPSRIPVESALYSSTIGTSPGAIASMVTAEVAAAQVIDLHTHLLPPSHGPLCLWGIDELITYHYLVAEYFMIAPPHIRPEEFYQWTKQKQADLIWQALFIDRCPLSEACRGVITLLVALGLETEVQSRDLTSIRRFFASFRDEGLEGTERFVNKVYQISGVRYAIMTNIPFDPTEAKYWRPHRKEYSHQFRSAVRVDAFLAGDRPTVERSLAAAGYEVSLEGARQYLRDWCDTMKPVYVMASTPHDFVWKQRGGESAPSGLRNRGINQEAMKEPGAAFTLAGANKLNDCASSCDESDATTGASVIDESSDLLSEVLMKVCEERNLPLALKIGAHRGVNPSLKMAGDGIVGFADAGTLCRLCQAFPRVRFLATFLSRHNQQEACVLAMKFRNLHLYGCWWFCNTPSMVEEISTMRFELMGASAAFTAQHSDARVMDQLIYKWAHTRSVLAQVLTHEFSKLVATGGWQPTRGEVRRHVQRLLGGSFEEFMSKSFIEE